MKKSLLLSALLLSAAASQAADVTASYQASAWLKSTSQTNFDAITPTNDGELFVGCTFDNGSATKDAADIFWGDTQIVAKDAYTGSIVKNVLMARVDAQFNPLWTIAPDFCQCENNSVLAATLPDGSVVYSFNLRASNALSGKAFSFTDTKGKKVEISVTPQATPTNTNCGLILCLSGTGEYRWHLAIEADNFTAEDPSVAAPVTYNATSLVTDDLSNVYLAGNYGGGYLKFGTYTTSSAGNTLITNGKASGASFFVAKIDMGLVYYVRTCGYFGTRPGDKETMQALAIDGDYLALAEFCDEQETGKSIKYIKFERNLLMEVGKAHSIATSGNCQLSSVAFADGDLLINGNANQELTQDRKTIYTPAKAKSLEGITIRASFAEGTPSTCYASGVTIGQTNYSWVSDGKLLTYGYCMTGNKVTLNVFDYATAKLQQTIDLAVAGTTRTAYFDPYGKILFGTSYARNNISFPGSDVTYKATTFNGILGAWKIAGLSGAINSVADDAVDADAPVEYYNLQGMRVANPSKGSLVIRRQGSKVAKVII